MPEETKRKISEALKKRGGGVPEAQASDKRVQNYEKILLKKQAELDVIAERLTQFKTAKQSMTAKQKRAFNESIKGELAEIAQTKKDIKEQKKLVKARRKARKKEIAKQIKIQREFERIQKQKEKAIERIKALRAKLKEKHEKEKVQMEKKKERLAELQQRKQEIESNPPKPLKVRKNETDEQRADREARDQMRQDKHSTRVAKANGRISQQQAKIADTSKSQERTQKILDKIAEQEAKVGQIKEDYGLADRLERLIAKFGEQKELKPRPRERAFIQNISVVEQFLNRLGQEQEKRLSRYEEKLKTGLSVGYRSALTYLKDGVVVLSRKGNQETKNSMNRFIKKLTKQYLSDPLTSEHFLQSVFGKVGRMAVQTLKENASFATPEFVIDEAQMRAFKKGYLSNIEAFLFNEPRRVLESIEANFGTEASQKLVLEQVGTIQFNRNIYKLSLLTHARGAVKAAIFDQSQRQGYTFWKKVVPKGTEKNLSPSGITALSLFLILTASQWNKRAKESVPNAVSDLGAHHGDFSYYYPISSEDLEEEQAIATRQRELLKSFFEREDEND